MPPAVYVLGLSVFCMGTTEVMVAGLLPALSAGLSITVPAAGLLISAFALGIVLGGPALTIALSRAVRRNALLGLLTVFLLGQVLGAVAPNYPTLLVSRIVSAVAFGAFFGIGASVAVELTGTSARARALSIMVGGLTLANVFGLPAATLLAEHLHWRFTFAAVAVLSALCLLAIRPMVPKQPRPAGIRVHSELAVFGRGRLWTALLTSALYQAAIMSAFGYLALLLIEVTGVPPNTVPGLLFLFGAGSFVGIYLGGRFSDRHPLLAGVVSLAALCLMLLIVGLFSRSLVGMLIATPLFGAAAFAGNPPLTARSMRAADDGALAAASNTSAFNLGIAVGPWVSGMALGAGIGYVAPVWIGLTFGVASLVTLVLAEKFHPLWTENEATPESALEPALFRGSEHEGTSATAGG